LGLVGSFIIDTDIYNGYARTRGAPLQVLEDAALHGLCQKPFRDGNFSGAMVYENEDYIP
jgi:hypothetical protein